MSYNLALDLVLLRFCLLCLISFPVELLKYKVPKDVYTVKTKPYIWIYSKELSTCNPVNSILSVYLKWICKQPIGWRPMVDQGLL